VKVAVAGSRTIEDAHLVEAAIAASGFDITELVSGTCRGVDRLAEQWAAGRGIPVTRFPADWRLGRRAGPQRNIRLINAVAADHGALIAVWDGTSRGTRHTIQYARQQGIPVYVHLTNGRAAAG
jgi:predicted Rossmann fold nucleotide-binding protein DprA/Smf involved in DNA uptake